MKVKCINRPQWGSFTIGKMYEVSDKKEIIKDNYNNDWVFDIAFCNPKNSDINYFNIPSINDMPYKELLMEYCIKKNDIINKAVRNNGVHGVYYMNKDDFDEVESWDEETCKKILNELYLTVMGTCPWCLLQIITNSNTCESCNYRERHGICDIECGNNFNRITEALRPIRIVCLLEELYNETKDKVKELRMQKECTL